MYLFDDSSIKLVKESTVVAIVDDKLGGNYGSPISKINTTRVVELLNKIGYQMANPTKDAEN